MMTLGEDFDPPRAARALIREARSAALATLGADGGAPYCSLVNLASDASLSPLLLISRLALHTKNILSDSRVSLMLSERRAGDPLARARVTLGGRAHPAHDDEARQRYLARHPSAETFASFGDFGFYRVEVTAIHLVAGFGRIVDLAAGDVTIDPGETPGLAAVEAEIVEHLNARHADALRLYAVALGRREEGPWQCVGCDAEGLELQLGHDALWLAFPRPAADPAALQQILREMAAAARAAQ